MDRARASAVAHGGLTWEVVSGPGVSAQIRPCRFFWIIRSSQVTIERVSYGVNDPSCSDRRMHSAGSFLSRLQELSLPLRRTLFSQ